jgi:hypothetical protein
MPNAYERAMGVGDVEILGSPAAETDGANVHEYQYEGQRKFVKGYKIDFGFGFDPATGLPTVIPNLGRQSFFIQPKTPFKPEEMIIPSEIAPGLFMTKMTHMDREYMDGDPIPCSGYSEVSTRRQLDLVTINTADRFQIEFLNLSGAAVGFYGSFRGKKVTT